MKNIKYILLILLISIIGLSSYLFTNYKTGHDTQYHFINALEVKKQIEEDLIYGSRIVGGIANDFGYGTRLFYPPLGHTSIAYIDLIVNDLEISFKIFNVIILFSSGIAMFFLVKKLALNEKIAFISSIIYMLASYHISDIIIRDALAETLVFISIPIILNGIYSLFYDNGKNFYPLFVFGYALGIISHATMMMYYTFLIFIFLAFHIKKLFTKTIFTKLVIASIFVLSMTSFFWVSMLEQNIHGDYRVFQEGVMVEGTQGNGLFLIEYLTFFEHHDFEIRFFINGIVILLLAITLIKYKKTFDNKFYKWLLILGIITVYMTTIVFPWDIFPKSLRVIQFPWRMVTYSILFISILAPLCLKIKENNKLITVVTIILILGGIFNFYDFKTKQFVNHQTDDLNYIDYYEIAMGWQKEYLPVNTYSNLDYFNNRNHDILNIEGSSKIIENNVPYLKFEVYESSTLELPRLYYYGYILRNENNEKIEVYENKNGFIETTVEPGIYTLDYEGSNLLKAADIITILSLLIFGGLKWKKLV